MKRIVITGAAGQIAYSLLFRIAHGDLFPGSEPLALHLYDLPEAERALEGVCMELEDGAFPLLREIQIKTEVHEAFKDVDLALLIGAKPRGKGMQRADLLQENASIFAEQGKALEKGADPNVKVFVVGNPCNTNALIAMHHAPKVSRKNFHAMMRLDQNRAAAQLAKRAKQGVDQVAHVTVWGNHSTTQVPDFTQATIGGKRDVIQDREWLTGPFIETVQNRGAAIIAARGKSSAASAASALVDAVRSLYTPTPEGEWFTSAVCTDGNPYGIEEGLIFGFPCRSKGDGDYEIVPDLPWDFFIKEKITLTVQELISERESVRKELL